MSQPIDPNRVVIFSGAGISLHERAGSSDIIHAHGEITKARSSIDSPLIYPIGDRSIQLGDKCEKESQLRPHVIWFGEDIQNFEVAKVTLKTAGKVHHPHFESQFVSDIGTFISNLLRTTGVKISIPDRLQ